MNNFCTQPSAVPSTICVEDQLCQAYRRAEEVPQICREAPALGELPIQEVGWAAPQKWEGQCRVLIKTGGQKIRKDSRKETGMRLGRKQQQTCRALDLEEQH